MKFVPSLDLFWPDEENVKDALHAKARIDAIDAALRHIRRRGACIQAGGWVGMWPIYLANFFDHVYTFEPVPYLEECLRKNLAHRRASNVTVHPVALGPRDGELMLTVASGGCTSARLPDDVKNQSRVIGPLTAPMTTIDGQFMTAPEVNAIFLDVERYEIDVLEGARAIMKKFSPVIVLEVLKGENERVFDWMEARGYEPRERAHNDWIFTRCGVG